MRKIIYCILAAVLGLICFTACMGGNTSESSQQSSSSSGTSNSIEFVQKEITLSVGESVQAEVITSKQNVYIFWSIREESVAVVSDKGVITGVAEGQTICYASFGGVEALCLVKVTAEKLQPLFSLSTPYQDGITLCVGDTFNPLLSVKLGDEVVDGAMVEYAVSVDTVVAVEDGMLVARGVGDATVTITATYEGQTASLTLPVAVVDITA